MNWVQNIWFMRELLLPTLDVLLLAFLIYKGYQILLQTRAVQLVKGALFLGLLYAIAFFLNLRTLLWIINLLAPSFVIGIAIIFQPELRKIFTRLGQGRGTNSLNRECRGEAFFRVGRKDAAGKPKLFGFSQALFDIRHSPNFPG